MDIEQFHSTTGMEKTGYQGAKSKLELASYITHSNTFLMGHRVKYKPWHHKDMIVDDLLMMVKTL